MRSRRAINRELSSLAFQRRVLSMALDLAVPLLERVRFLTITCANLDEFFEIRVSRLQRQVELGLTASGADGLPPNETLNRIHEVSHAIAMAVAEEVYAKNLTNEPRPDDLAAFLSAQMFKPVYPDYSAK